MEACIRALERTRNLFLAKKNVVGVGVGMKEVGFERTKKPSIIVFVEKKYKMEDLQRKNVVPQEIYGVATDVIEIGKVRLLDGRTGKDRPARPGSSMGHYKISAGTFGCVVKDIKTGESLILSNNHILANTTDGRDGRAVPGDAILQPGSYDGGSEKDKIAELLRYIPIIREAKESECPVAAGVARIGNSLMHLIRPNYDIRFIKKYRGSNEVDAALARPLLPDMISNDILEVGSPQGVASAEVNMLVTKSGRSSGVTSGKVTAVDVTLQVGLNDTEVGMFSNQVVAEMSSKGGDSGSLVVDESKRAVGLLFAGSEKYTIFNRLNVVLTKLGVVL